MDGSNHHSLLEYIYIYTFLSAHDLLTIPFLPQFAIDNQLYSKYQVNWKTDSDNLNLATNKTIPQC
jgi:hypothetical protein